MKARRGAPAWAAGVLLALVLAGFVSQFASAAPDGLEWVAQATGFSHAAQDGPAGQSPLAGYQAGDGPLGGALAGVIGTLVVLGLGLAIAFLVRRRGHHR